MHEIDRVVQACCEESPGLLDYLSDTRRLGEYSASLWRPDPVPDVHLQRQQPVRDFLEAVAARLLPQHLESVRRLRGTPLRCSCADHHGVLANPATVSANVVAHLSREGGPRPATVALTNAAVPMNNRDHKRGFEFRGENVVVFDHAERHQTAYVKPRKEFRFVDRLQRSKRWRLFSETQLDFLARYESWLNAAAAPGARNYREQIQSIVARQWELLFEPSLRADLPPLVYLPHEDGARCIFEPIFAEADRDSFLWRTLFEPAFRADVLEAFRGIRGTWDESRSYGTHFFWLIGDKRELVRLYVEGDHLVPEQARYRSRAVRLQPDAVLQAVRSELLCPGLFYCHACLVFWAGIRPLLGPTSATYMTSMKRAWQKTLAPGRPDEAARIADINTQRLAEGPLAVFARNERQQLVPQSAADLIAAGGLGRDYVDRVADVPFSEALRLGLAARPQNNLSQTSTALFAERSFDWVPRTDGRTPAEVTEPYVVAECFPGAIADSASRRTSQA